MLLCNKGPSSQSYGFSSGHVWMWELDHNDDQVCDRNDTLSVWVCVFFCAYVINLSLFSTAMRRDISCSVKSLHKTSLSGISAVDQISLISVA